MRPVPFLPILVAAVGILAATGAVSAAQLTLTWQDQSSNEDGFRIERRTGTSGTFAQIAAVGRNVTTHTDSTVAVATSYCYRVSAYNGAGSSPASNVACGTPTGPTVTIAATTPIATEAGPTAGQFTVTRTGDLAAALSVSYTVSGTATPGTDYVTLPGVATMAAGSPTGTITVTPINDTLVEGEETVVVTLDSSSEYTTGSPSSATVTIVSDDTPSGGGDGGGGGGGGGGGETPPPPSPGDIVIDNGQPGTSFTGTWLPSSVAGSWGSSSLVAAGSGVNKYRWRPVIPTPGVYDVYVWWTSHATRSPSVRYQVTHETGIFTTTRDQRTGGGQWQLLGRFSFLAGDAGHVDVSDINGPTVIADAARFAPVTGGSAPPPPPSDGDVVIDNGAPRTSFTGRWSVSSAPHAYGPTSLHSDGPESHIYRWTPTLPARHYRVYVWWVSASDRSSSVRYQVRHATGTSTTTRDQRTGGGQWQLLGTFRFNAGSGGYVEVSDVNGGRVSADAVRFSPVGIVIDNGQAGTRFTGSWQVSTGPSPYGSNSLEAASAGLDKYRWTPTIPAAGEYAVYVWWTALPSRSRTVEYQVRHASGTYTTTRNQQKGGGQWRLLGTFSFKAGTTGYVQVSDVNGTGVCADAVQLLPR